MYGAKGSQSFTENSPHTFEFPGAFIEGGRKPMR